MGSNNRGNRMDKAGNNTAMVHNSCNNRMVDKGSSKVKGNRNYQGLSGMKRNQPGITVQTITVMFL